MGSILTAALAGCLMAGVCMPAFAAGALSNRRAPGFSLPDSTMKQHDPLDYRGKILLLEFMQTPWILLASRSVVVDVHHDHASMLLLIELSVDLSTRRRGCRNGPSMAANGSRSPLPGSLLSTRRDPPR